ncbi:MAG: hypothetical protein DA408_09770 [Bacteroidetes bacterium]|nr:MAG: hypothetical protein C7N36_05575 [Bacteroidota bacterium]PTM12686.1 MAG: hypothetical protein DA408_09770 [Bacteroidota bacterium]
MNKEAHNNTYTFNLKEEEKHISEVERGRKGYYCMGCNEEVEAVKGKIKRHYFRHVPTDVNTERKCTYSDETYRHKLAKEILQRIKKIKVPTLYKYPPSGIDAKPIKIRDAWTIEANTVKNERQFYEDINGEIGYGKNIDFEKEKGKFLLIQPDVAFFDKDDNPILLIEVVATHKIDSTKLSKIKRLGIDTVQVTIPKDSPEEIENCFFRTHRTQWIYNYEQETTTYVHISEGNNQGISPVDEFQRKLFRTAESYSCRSSQINNLIRGIRKCLESEQYRKTKQSIRGELDRVSENTKRNRERLFNLQKGHRNKIEREFELEERTLKAEEEGFNRKEAEFQKEVGDLERRYYSKREELETVQREYKPECQSEIKRLEEYLEELGTDRASFEEQIAELERQEEQFEQQIRKETARIMELTGKEQGAFNELETRRKKFPIENERLEGEFEERERSLKQEIGDSQEGIRRQFEELGREAVEAVKGKDSSGESRIHSRIKDTLYKGRLLVSIRQGKSRIRTLERAKELYDSGAYKSWNESR